MPWPVRSEDHTGGKICLRPLATDAFSGGIPSPQAAKMRREVVLKWLPAVATFIIINVAVALIMAIIIAEHGLIFIGLFIHGPIIATVITFPLVAIQLAWWMRKKYAAWIETRSLSVAQCPSCTYGLAGVTPAETTMVTCPECNAAWRAADVGKNPASPRQVVVIDSNDSSATDHAADRSASERVRELPLV